MLTCEDCSHFKNKKCELGLELKPGQDKYECIEGFEDDYPFASKSTPLIADEVSDLKGGVQK